MHKHGTVSDMHPDVSRQRSPPTEWETSDTRHSGRKGLKIYIILNRLKRFSSNKSIQIKLKNAIDSDTISENTCSGTVPYYMLNSKTVYRKTISINRPSDVIWLPN